MKSSGIMWATSIVATVAAVAAGATVAAADGDESEPEPVVDCDPVSDETKQFLFRLEFWLEGVVVMSIGFVGLLGNSVAIPLLFSKNLESIFNRLLVCLAITDNIFISTCLLEAVRRHIVTSNFQQIAFIHFIYQARRHTTLVGPNILSIGPLDFYQTAQ